MKCPFTQEGWDAMPRSEKYEYLKDHVIETQGQQVLDSTATVGDSNALSKKYKAVCGGVVIGTWEDTPKEAIETAEKVIEHEYGPKDDE